MKNKFYCIDCNKIVSKQNVKRCHSCENKRKHKLGILNSVGINNPNFGNHKVAGKNHPFYGKKLNKNHREKISKNHANVSGKNNPNYIDGRTNRWKKVRKKCFERDNYTCVLCHKRGNIYLNAHHIINRHDCKNRFDLANLVTLCIMCHNHITNIEKTTKYIIFKNNFISYIINLKDKDA